MKLLGVFPEKVLLPIHTGPPLRQLIAPASPAELPVTLQEPTFRASSTAMAPPLSPAELPDSVQLGHSGAKRHCLLTRYYRLGWANLMAPGKHLPVGRFSGPPVRTMEPACWCSLHLRRGAGGSRIVVRFVPGAEYH
jgi:hypothetical protein